MMHGQKNIKTSVLVSVTLLLLMYGTLWHTSAAQRVI